MPRYNLRPRPAPADQIDPSKCYWKKLPGELKNLVYHMALEDHDAGVAAQQKLTQLRIPPLAQTAPRLRDELLPLFFHEKFTDKSYTIAVGTNANICGENKRQAAGTLGLPRGMRAALRNTLRFQNLGSTPILRNVEFFVYPADEVSNARDRDLQKRNNALQWLITRLHITVDANGVVTTQQRAGNNHPGLVQLNKPRVFDGLFERARTTAQEIGRRQEFKGFTVDDLDAIAKEFRVEKRVTTAPR